MISKCYRSAVRVNSKCNRSEREVRSELRPSKRRLAPPCASQPPTDRQLALWILSKLTLEAFYCDWISKRILKAILKPRPQTTLEETESNKSTLHEQSYEKAKEPAMRICITRLRKQIHEFNSDQHGLFTRRPLHDASWLVEKFSK